MTGLLVAGLGLLAVSGYYAFLKDGLGIALDDRVMVDSLVALITLAGLVVLERKRVVLAAFLLALAISLKPTPTPILLVVLGFNLLGDALTDWLDPRRRDG